MTVGSTLAVDQYHCCQADLARDPDSALPDRRKQNHNRKKSKTTTGRKGQNTPAGRRLNVVLP